MASRHGIPGGHHGHSISHGALVVHPAPFQHVHPRELSFMTGMNNQTNPDASSYLHSTKLWLLIWVPEQIESLNVEDLDGEHSVVYASACNEVGRLLAGQLENAIHQLIKGEISDDCH
jgi:hypothetical protein